MKKKTIIGLIAIAILTTIIVSIFIICPPGGGQMRQFVDEKGEIMANSISEKTQIKVEGYDVNLYILGEDISKPVLLVCGGGPGIPQYLLENLYPSVLPEKFVVCYYDYIACGASYVKTDPKKITNELLFEETLAITDYLKERFDKEKIYIMGHSFGSFVALNVAQSHPENYIAYLAVAQTTNQTESEYMAYDYMKAKFEEMGDKKMVAAMEKYKVRESAKELTKYKYSAIRDKAMHALGLGTTREMNSVITGLVLPSLQCKAYTLPERFKIWMGKIQSNDFAAGIKDFNAFEEIPSLEIPVYFFGGEYDYTCCIALQKDYYDCLEAPEKQFFLYEGAAHSPVYENREKTSEILDEIVGRSNHLEAKYGTD